MLAPTASSRGPIPPRAPSQPESPAECALRLLALSIQTGLRESLRRPPAPTPKRYANRYRYSLLLLTPTFRFALGFLGWPILLFSFPYLLFCNVRLLTHSLGQKQSLPGYTGPKHLEPTGPVLVDGFGVQRHEFHRDLCHSSQRFADELHRKIVANHALLNRLACHGFDLDERCASRRSGFFRENVRYLQ